MTDTLFNFQSLADIQSADPHHAAKLAYVQAVEHFQTTGKQAQQRGRKPSEQLLSPVERILLAHMTIEEETTALIAILGAPALLPAHKARAVRAAQEIAKARHQASSFFDLVKERCRFKEDYDRKKVTA